MITIHAHVAAARQRLRAAGIPADEAEIDARVLAEHLLGWDAARFFSSANQEEPEGFAADYERLVARRAAREPVAYVVGRQEFWDLSFEVSPAVLIPRPETELIVETSLELFPDRVVEVTIADVCTGSGCLAVALACERPQARLTAIDISGAALDVARLNAVRHGVGDRVHFVRANILDRVTDCFDLIVANPPYVPDGERASLQPEVRDHEPALALLGGVDGLTVVRRLVEQAPSRLNDRGVLIFEFGIAQVEPIAGLISASEGLTMIDVRRDLQGIPRTVIARRTRVS
jgi:release factor glutamine methyltransferase